MLTRTSQAQAVKAAEETAKAVETELKDLAATLKNIESARPFEECTVDDITSAEPSIERKVEHHVKNHRWMPAGYKVRSETAAAFVCTRAIWLLHGFEFDCNKY